MLARLAPAILAAGYLVVAAQANDILLPNGAVSAKGLATYCASDKKEEQYFCFGYIGASLNQLGIAGDLMRRGETIDLVAVCPKGTMDVGKNIKQFVIWMRNAPPDRVNGRAAIAVIEFLKEKYPCRSQIPQ